MAKKYVPIFFDWQETTVDLSQEEKGNLIDAVVRYASGTLTEDEIIQGLNGVERVAFRFMKGQIDRSEDISEARSQAGKNKSKQTETKNNKQQQNLSNESIPEQAEAKSNDNNNNKDEYKDKNNKEKAQKRFAPPSLEEVRVYCQGKGYRTDPEQFVDFYASKGWKVGNQPMKDWQAALRTWEKRETTGWQSRAPAKTVIAQQYSQRDYSGAEESMDDMLMRLEQEAKNRNS